VAVVANACELVEPSPPPIRLWLDSPLGIAFGGGQLVSTDWPCRMLFEEGGFHCGIYAPWIYWVKIKSIHEITPIPISMPKARRV
jgi:hypothetical protein